MQEKWSRRVVVVVVCSAVPLVVLAGSALSSGGTPSGSSASLARLRIVVATEAAAARIVVDPGAIVLAKITSAAPDVDAAAAGHELSIARRSRDASETTFDLLVSGLEASQTVRWRLQAPSAAATRIEIYNDNDRHHATLVDRFDTDATDATFESRTDLLVADGPVAIEAGPAPLVLAFDYPWYLHATWSQTTPRRLIDRPLAPYSTELPDEVARSLADACAAGLDGLIVSWVGNMDWSDRRLRIVLDKAQPLGLKVSILVETLLATETLADGTEAPSADTLRRWLEKATDAYPSHPAFLTVQGKPVIFVYAADVFTPAAWSKITASLAATGRHALIIGEATDPSFLDSFAGEFTYATATTPLEQLGPAEASQMLAARSYNLLHGGTRRIAAATVSPGYDDRLLGREHPIVVERDAGSFYNAQWAAAMAAQPDWILVTSWNEFFENTHIEPSVVYGRTYQSLTRRWSTQFGSGSEDRPRRSDGDTTSSPCHPRPGPRNP